MHHVYASSSWSTYPRFAQNERAIEVMGKFVFSSISLSFAGRPNPHTTSNTCKSWSPLRLSFFFAIVVTPPYTCEYNKRNNGLLKALYVSHQPLNAFRIILKQAECHIARPTQERPDLSCSLIVVNG